MGHYQMAGNKGNTKANHKDPRYIQAFEQLRNMEYTIGEARWVAEDAVKLMDEHPDWTVSKAIMEVFE